MERTERKETTIVDISQLRQQERGVAEAAQEIVGKLNQISQEQGQPIQGSTLAQNQDQVLIGEFAIKRLPIKVISIEAKRAKREKMLHLFEKAAA